MNCLFVIMGASGDLTKKKLIPAIYHLLKNKEIQNFAIIGISRQDFTTDSLIKFYKPYVKNSDPKIWDEIKKRIYYFKADFNEDKKFHELAVLMKKTESKHNLSGNRLFYLATLPEHFELIAHQLSKHKLAPQNKTWSRVVFEKPFGNDLKSAIKLNNCLKRVFKEDQIYRIDHYLGKELVQNISILRFTNTILEPLWNRKYIDHVQIAISEDIGVEQRGGFYDKYGALKDVIQNHSLQLLALTTMESPKHLTEKHIRDEKVKVLKSTKVKDVSLGQYNGYLKEPKVPKNSKTETFAALKLNVNNDRWKNVPFYLVTGKFMKEKLASIYVEFKKTPGLMFENVYDYPSNFLAIQVQPEEGFYVQINSKSPRTMDIIPINMDFCHSCKFGPNTPEAYETLLFDVLKGDQSAFIRSDEIEEAWKIIDKIKKPKIQTYKKRGIPNSAKKLIKKDGKQWHLTINYLSKSNGNG
ncbi:MAG: glucose-6-phosphate dehydrogenase [Nanoarchaeota archaeon]|nr:glucose-6-phosphate dehydrogenase [Nanoarchaeota archaeon]